MHSLNTSTYVINSRVGLSRVAQLLLFGSREQEHNSERVFVFNACFLHIRRTCGTTTECCSNFKSRSTVSNAVFIYKAGFLLISTHLGATTDGRSQMLRQKKAQASRARAQFRLPFLFSQLAFCLFDAAASKVRLLRKRKERWEQEHNSEWYSCSCLPFAYSSQLGNRCSERRKIKSRT